MDKIGLIFPGQGSQYAGMGKIIYDEIKSAKYLMDRSNEVLGFDIKSIIFGTDDELLKSTDIAQPAIYIISAMYFEKFKALNVDFNVVAGHSLGEYSALYANGVLSFEDGLMLVRKRGLLMSQSSDISGGMIAVIGLSNEEVEKIISDYQDLFIANINSRIQTVISGKLEVLKQIVPVLEQKANKVIPLKVSAAFHTPYMQNARIKMEKEINKITFHDPIVPIIPNITAKPTQNADEIKRCLIDQITGQVKWLDTIITMKNMGIDKLYEVGPNDVLKKINMTITSKMKVKTLDETM